MMIRFLLLLGLVMGLGGCASMTPAGQRVETVSPAEVAGMTFVG